MHRIRLFIVMFAVFFALGVAPAMAQQEMTGDDAPAIVLEDEKAPVEEPAWTFRYLVPTLLGVSAIAIGFVVVAYGVRVRGRYRVSQ